MPPRSLLARRLAPLCLALAFMWPWAGRPARAEEGATLALEACGAFAREPALGTPWPGAKAVRLGEMALPGDKGLGCRFILTGEPAGAASVVEIRLTRPGPDGESAEDRWFVPVRRGEAALAAYGFTPGQPPAAGPWSLTLTAEGASPVVARFVVAAGDAPPPPPVDPSTAAPAKPSVGTQAALPPPAVAEPESAGPAPVPAESAAPQTVARSAPPAPSALPKPTAAPATPAGPATPAKASAAKASAAKAATQKSPPKDKPAAKAGYVALQTGLFADADNAAAQAAKLRSRGMPACLSVSGSGAKRRYRVLAGRFGDRRAAVEARHSVSAMVGLSPLIYDVPPAEASRLRCQ